MSYASIKTTYTVPLITWSGSLIRRDEREEVLIKVMRAPQKHLIPF
jgi:hypothetical protein